jgi:hypothetical protein
MLRRSCRRAEKYRALRIGLRPVLSIFLVRSNFSREMRPQTLTGSPCKSVSRKGVIVHGITILERSSGGVRATEAGRHFLRVLARSILEHVESLVTTAHGAGRGKAGVGFYTSLSAGNLRARVVDYVHRFSGDFAWLERELADASCHRSSRNRLCNYDQRRAAI